MFRYIRRGAKHAHITLAEGVPGILGPMLFRPETAKPLNQLAEVLLRGRNSLSPAERELIATYVSAQNDCFFCPLPSRDCEGAATVLQFTQSKHYCHGRCLWGIVIVVSSGNPFKPAANSICASSRKSMCLILANSGATGSPNSFAIK